MARVQGFPGYQYAIITHPISNLDRDQIRARALQALPEVLEILGLEDGQAEPTRSSQWLQPSPVSS
jgi:hypothetical protein